MWSWGERWRLEREKERERERVRAIKWLTVVIMVN